MGLDEEQDTETCLGEERVSVYVEEDDTLTYMDEGMW